MICPEDPTPQDLSPMTREEADQLLRQAYFRFAKTMAHIPHSYTRRREWPDSSRFEALVQFIRDTGTKEKFGKTSYVYHYLDGYKYWSMGWPAWETILINRAAVS